MLATASRKLREELVGSQRFGEGRIDLVVIPGEENVTTAARLEWRRDEDMIEAHLAAPLKVPRPSGSRACQKGMEVINFRGK
jgi:hypothetical protein